MLWALLLVLADLSAFVTSSLVAFALVAAVRGNAIAPVNAALAAGPMIALNIVLFSVLGLYRRTYALSPRDAFYSVQAAMLLCAATLLGLFTLLPTLAASRAELLLAFVISSIVVGSERALLESLHQREQSSLGRIAVLGRSASEVADALKRSGRNVVTILGQRLDDTDVSSLYALAADPSVDHGIPWLRAAQQVGCDHVVLTEMPDAEIVPPLVQLLESRGMSVAFAPASLASRACAMRVEQSSERVVLVAVPLAACRMQWRALKRAADLVLGLLALVLFLPVMACAALATLVDSGRPILFRQTRVGRGGRNFEILKFRTMPVDVESGSGPVWSPAGDRRPTRVGRFLRRTSFDELPQLFNVLRGEMSLVGPRPERPCFVERFAHEYPRYRERFLMKPGITGWAHVEMKRNAAPSEIGQRIEFDLSYIEEWSPLLDGLIVLKTAAEFLFQRAS